MSLPTLFLGGYYHFRLNKLPHCILEGCNFNFRSVRLCDLAIPIEK